MLNRFWRLCFKLLYNELAFTYDAVSRQVSLGHWRSWQRCALRYLPEPEEGIVLELAHGTGDLQIDLQRQGYATVALDLSSAMGRLAQRKLQRTHLRADLARADAMRLPYRSGAIGTVVCTFPTSFVFSEQVLAELARILQSSGRAIFVLSGQLQGRGVIRAFIRQLYRLTGQREGLLNESDVREVFRAPQFNIDCHIVRVYQTAVQIAVLTVVQESDKSQPDISLDFAKST
ncbi:MAG: methyltransferase domain-containing protein [Chloroflexi bacterium]|nr:methyltransferase domain-containing protein [Chloroflexota bacterium]